MLTWYAVTDAKAARRRVAAHGCLPLGAHDGASISAGCRPFDRAGVAYGAERGWDRNRRLRRDLRARSLSARKLATVLQGERVQPQDPRQRALDGEVLPRRRAAPGRSRATQAARESADVRGRNRWLAHILGHGGR